MKYFTALADSEFARSAFKAAGLDFDSLKAAKNTEAIKAAASAAVSSDLAAAETSLKAAKQENDELAGRLTQATADLAAITEGRAALAAILNPLTAALESAGLKVESFNDAKGNFSAEKFNSALNAHVAKATTIALGKTGHPPVPHVVPTEAKPAAVAADGKPLTGLARTQAAFAAQIAASVARRN